MTDRSVFDRWLKEQYITQNAYCHLSKIPVLSEKTIINNDWKISVAISTHNRAKELEVLINSILSQTYPNYEIVIIDDGSADNTEIIVRDYIEKYGNVFVYYKNPIPLGVSNAKRKGYELSSGDIVIFSDDDDYYIDDGYFSELVDIYRANRDCVMTVASTIDYYVDSDSYVLQPLNYNKPIPNDDYLRGFLSRYNKPGSMLTLSMRANAMKKSAFSELMCFNDMSLYLYGALSEGMIYPIVEAKAVYSRKSNSMSSKVSSQFIIDNLDAKKNIGLKAMNKGWINDCEKWTFVQCEPTIMLFFSCNNIRRKEKEQVILWIKKNFDKQYQKALLYSAHKLIRRNFKTKLRSVMHIIKNKLLFR